jgi:hypothetical protein
VRNTEEATKPREWLTLGKVADHYRENIEGKKTARKEAVVKSHSQKEEATAAATEWSNSEEE